MTISAAQPMPIEKPQDKNGEDPSATADHASLKYSLLGPSLTKAGQDSVDQSKASKPLPFSRVGSGLTCRPDPC